MDTDVIPEVKMEEVNSSENVSELEKKIIRQVEYYFGDYNLNMDLNLKQQITLDDGWVPLNTLRKFGRLRALSKDIKVICEALKKSSSGLVELNPESTKIRRSPDKPLLDPISAHEEIMNKSVYVNGFKKATTFDELLDFFEVHKAESISMLHLKPPQKGFNGSCFVTFETLEDAEKFLGLKGIKYQGTELLRETKKDFLKREVEMHQKLTKQKESKIQQRAEAMKKDGEDLETNIVSGCLLKVTGLSSEITRKDLKAPLGKYGKVAFLDYSKGKPEGIVRFQTGVAKDALEGLSVEEDGVKKIDFKGVKATATLVEGEEEEEYWKHFAKASKLRNCSRPTLDAGLIMDTDVIPEVKMEEVNSSENVSELEKKIIRQVEYYFGNYNLNIDWFLKQQITLDDGWVPLNTLIKFNRLRLNPECTKIRRSPDKPLLDPISAQEEIMNKSVYVKGFKKATTLDELLDFFEVHKAESISMLHLNPPQKGFKGSCFVTFETLEDAEKFLGLKGIKYQGTELLRETKKDFLKREVEMHQKLTKQKESKIQQRAEAMKKDGEDLETNIVSGCLLKVTGLSSEITRKDLKAPLGKYGKVAFLDYSKGKPEGIVRFQTGVAKDALEGLSVEEDGVKKIDFKGVKATATLVEGEEEEEYWKHFAISKASKLRNCSRPTLDAGLIMDTDVIPEVKMEEVNSSENVSELEKKIIRQVEYYFGNYNLNIDWFLKQQITLDDGWVPLNTLIKFNRLRTLSEDIKVICEALKKSSSGLIELNPECTKIRRSPDKPLLDPISAQEEIMNKSVYVKGFKKATTLDELLDFFDVHKAESISMLHLNPPKKGFKGSCFVTFETLEVAEKFLGLKGIKYQGNELRRETKKDFLKREVEMHQKRTKQKESKIQQRAEAMKKDGEDLETNIVSGCLLKVTGLSSEITREDLKAPLGKYGKVAFVDYSKGKPEGIVRFQTGVAKDALEGLSVEEDGVKKIDFKGVKATATLVEGEEEEEYWKHIAISKASKLGNS